jgi:hypothetical protein
VTDLVAWLRQQLDTDERTAQARLRDHTQFGPSELDPDHLLRQVQAHRAILDRYELARSHPTSLVSSFVRGQDNGFWQGLEEAVKELVSIYSDRDGWREEWSA